MTLLTERQNDALAELVNIAFQNGQISISHPPEKGTIHLFFPGTSILILQGHYPLLY